jgi:glycosyltransferase involved in cell wall biosynthesis
VPTIRTYAPNEPLAVVENGVDLERFHPRTDREAVRAQLGVSDRFVVSYIGTIGMAHGLESLLDAAAILRDRMPAAQLLVVGEGAEREHIEHVAAARTLTNVRFLGPRPRHEIPSLVTASDVCLVLLRPSEVFRTVLPSKMLEFMACGTPSIVAVDGFARGLIEKSEGGVYVESGNPAALAEAIVAMAGDAAARVRMGASGREFVARHFSRNRKAIQYITALEETVRPVRRADRAAATSPLAPAANRTT